MSLSKESLATRREHLTNLIGRQRVDFAEAYRDLGRPIQYTQTGIKSLQMLKQNAWLVALAPSLIGVVSALLGLKKNQEKPRSWLRLPFGKKKTAAVEEEEGDLVRQASRRARPLLTRLVHHGIALFKLYRKIRPFIPL